MTSSPPAANAVPDAVVRYAYLGPIGTFTQAALNVWLSTHPLPAGAPQPQPEATVATALAAVREGRIEAAMVPIENSVEGGVSATLDALAEGDPLVVIGEVLVPISFVLAAPPGVALEQVRAVGTHSHAWAQVREWMANHLPQAEYVPTSSTASAAADLSAWASQGGQSELDYQAAVCAQVAAADHGLEVLASDIGDRSGAVTRFALVARPGSLPEPTGADKTTLVLFQRSDHAGALLELLEQFAVRGVNITRLESRPTKVSMGSYCFSIDIEGHVRDERVGEALMGLKRVAAQVLFLGSYPAASGTPVTVAPDTANDSFTAARSWLASLRS